VPRVRSGGAHRATLVTTWTVHLTGIEFIDDYSMEANGRNLSDTDPDRKRYSAIPEDFKGWGRGASLTGWDWEGSDNQERAACYRRGRPLHMRVRLRSSVAAPSARTFTLHVKSTVDGRGTLLTPGSVSVSWPAGSQEQIVPLISTGGALPNEGSRYQVRLTWEVSGIVPGGVIKRTTHKIFGIYEDPLDPIVSSATGAAQSPVTGSTKQRLDKLTELIGGAQRRFPTLSVSDIDRLIWRLHVHVNDSGPPHFDGKRSVAVRYGSGGPSVDWVDQWVMWLSAREWHRPGEKKSWNVGACISYVQWMKTILAAAGINSRRAWVLPKTTRLPNGSTVSLAANDLISFDNLTLGALEQKYTFSYSGLTYSAAVRLIDTPEGGVPTWENFEACLYYGGKLVPGAISTHRYPASVLSGRVGFADSLEVLRWWHSVSHGSFHRFMAWVSDTPWGCFDKDGTFYTSPYDIPAAKWLPVP